MSYKYRFSSILKDLKDNPLVPKEFKAKLDTLWLLDLAGNDTDFSEDEKEYLIDIANKFVLENTKTKPYQWLQSKAYCSGLPIKKKARY